MWRVSSVFPRIVCLNEIQTQEKYHYDNIRNANRLDVTDYKTFAQVHLWVWDMMLKINGIPSFWIPV